MLFAKTLKGHMIFSNIHFVEASQIKCNHSSDQRTSYGTRKWCNYFTRLRHMKMFNVRMSIMIISHQSGIIVQQTPGLLLPSNWQSSLQLAITEGWPRYVWGYNLLHDRIQGRTLTSLQRRSHLIHSKWYLNTMKINAILIFMQCAW